MAVPERCWNLFAFGVQVYSLETEIRIEKGYLSIVQNSLAMRLCVAQDIYEREAASCPDEFKAWADAHVDVLRTENAISRLKNARQIAMWVRPELEEEWTETLKKRDSARSDLAAAYQALLHLE